MIFFNIKPFWVDDFGQNYKFIILEFVGGGGIRTIRFLMRMLSMCINFSTKIWTQL
jgi:hypothetical protein